MAKELYSNAAVGFLSGPVTSTSATSISLISSTMFPSTGNFTVKCDNEIMTVSANASNAFTVARGQEGTTAATHADNASIYAVLSDASLRKLVRQSHGGTLVGARREINLVDGGGVTWTMTDDSTNDKVDVSAVVASGYEAARTTVPAVSTFTWVNQGTSTATDAANGLLLVSQIGTGNNGRMLMKTAPATPWTMTIKALPTVYFGASNVAGVAVRDSGTSKVIRFGWNDRYVLLDKLTNETNYSAGYATASGGSAMTPWTWLRVNDDGTNLTFSMSVDGVSWTQMYQVSRTNFLAAPNQVGLYVESNSSTLAAELKVVSFLIN